MAYPYQGFTDSTRLLDMEGSIMSINASDSTKIDVTEGLGIFIDNATDPKKSITKTITLPEQTGVLPTSTTGASFVSYKVNATSGLPELNFNPTAISGEQIRDEPFIGVITHPSNGDISRVDDITLVTGNSGGANWADWTRAALGVTVQEGGRGNRIFTEDSLRLSKSAGTYFWNAIQARDNLKNPNLLSTEVLPFGTPIFQAWTTTDGSGVGLTLDLDGIVLDPSIYDDGTAVQADGAPQGTVNDHEWQNIHIWYLLAFDLLTMQYGKIKYGNSNAARQAIKSEGFDNSPIYNGSTPTAVITVRGGATTLNNDFDGFLTQGDRLGSH